MKFFSTKIWFTTKDFLEILYEMMMNELRPSLTSGGVLMNKTRVLLFRWPCKKGNHTHWLNHHTCHFICFDNHNYIPSNESLLFLIHSKSSLGIENHFQDNYILKYAWINCFLRSHLLPAMKKITISASTYSIRTKCVFGEFCYDCT